jgi:sarcosine oxidase subunit gamma
MPRRSPLAPLIGRAGERLPLAERPFLGRINLRGRSADPAFGAAVRAVLNLDLPLQPDTTTRDGDRVLLWLGPDEWLAQVPDSLRALLLDRLRGTLHGQLASVTDVSDAYTTIDLDHPRAGDLLSRGCPLDLDPSIFPPGACAQSLFGKAGILLQRESPERFAITVRRSFARYLYDALQDAAALELQ